MQEQNSLTLSNPFKLRNEYVVISNGAKPAKIDRERIPDKRYVNITLRWAFLFLNIRSKSKMGCGKSENGCRKKQLPCSENSVHCAGETCSNRTKTDDIVIDDNECENEDEIQTQYIPDNLNYIFGDNYDENYEYENGSVSVSSADSPDSHSNKKCKI